MRRIREGREEGRKGGKNRGKREGRRKKKKGKKKGKKKHQCKRKRPNPKVLCAGVSCLPDVRVRFCEIKVHCPCDYSSSSQWASSMDCLSNGTCAHLCNVQCHDPKCVCGETPDGQSVCFAPTTGNPCAGQQCSAATDCAIGQACQEFDCGGRCVMACLYSGL